MNTCPVTLDGTIFLSVSQEHTGMRIDVFLSQRVHQYSRTFFQELIAKGQVQVNTIVATKHSWRLKEGDTITCLLPVTSSPQPRPLPADLTIPIVFEHEHFLILNKPPFLSVHPPHLHSQEIALTDWLISNDSTLKSIGYFDRPGIVHRLDKNTSGLLIIARTNYAHMRFTDLFKNRAIHKTYIALVHGHPERCGSIDLPIARDPIKKTIMTHKLASGRAALTHFKVLQYFKDYSLVEVSPVTGRTHQIRVHMAALGHPIASDSSYGAPFIAKLKRHALHAAKLSFNFEGQNFVFESQTPHDLQTFIDSLPESE